MKRDWDGYDSHLDAVAAVVGFVLFLEWQEGLEQALKVWLVSIEVVGQDVFVDFVDCRRNN